MFLKKQCNNCNSYYSYDAGNCPYCGKVGIQIHYKRVAIERLLVMVTLGLLAGLVCAIEMKDSGGFGLGIFVLIGIISIYSLYYYFGRDGNMFGWISDKFDSNIPEYAKHNFSFGNVFSEILYFIVIFVLASIGFGIVALWQWLKAKEKGA